jgi:hypothetical protein
METLGALIVTDTPDRDRCGIRRIQRMVVTTYRAEIERIHLVSRTFPEFADLEALRARGIRLTVGRRSEWPFTDVPRLDRLVVMSADAVVRPAALKSLVAHADLRPGEAALMIDHAAHIPDHFVKVSNGRVVSWVADDNAARSIIAILSGVAVLLVRDAFSVRQALRRLARYGVLKAFDAVTHGDEGADAR